MPIKPENAKLYPPDWKAIRSEVLARAGNRCEECGAPNYALVQEVDGERRFAKGSLYYDDFQYTGSFREANEARMHLNEFEDENPFIMVVLTIAHLDHVPENVGDPGNRPNLRAWCQKCHLTYDAKHHAQNAAKTRHKRKAIGELF